MSDKPVDKRITQARSQLVAWYPFFGYLSLYLTPIPREDMPMPTMGTDGEHLFYDPGFVKRVSDEDLRGLICHECLHAALGHIWRKGAREPLRWNIAADAVVNRQLREAGFNLMPNGIPPDEKGLSVEELYTRVKIKEIQLKGQGTSDDHNDWGKTKKGQGLGGSEGRKLSNEWKDRIRQARMLAKSQGSGMGGLEQEIDELLEPKVSWQELLRRFLLISTKSNYRLLPPNKKHLWRGFYLPSLYGEEIEIAFAIDTSGSMTDKMVQEGLSEVKAICDQFDAYTIHFFQCDDGIQEYREMTTYNFDFPKKVKGRGGTSFVPVFEEITKKGINPTALVFFTDLMGTFPNMAPGYPVIWLAVTDIKVPFGEVIRYESADKNRWD